MPEPTEKDTSYPQCLYSKPIKCLRGNGGQGGGQRANFPMRGSSSPGGDANTWSIRLNYRVFVFCFVFETVSHCVIQADLGLLHDSSASAYRVLGLQVCIIMLQLLSFKVYQVSVHVVFSVTLRPAWLQSLLIENHDEEGVWNLFWLLAFIT